MATSKPDAGFDPAVSDAATPDYGKYSSGFKLNSIGPSLDAFGDLVKMTSSAVDEYYKGSIRDEATERVDYVRDQWAPPTMGRGDVPNKGVDRNTLPPELAGRLNKLDHMQQARAAGTLKDSHYYGLLDQQARELRYKYAGYREHIDNVIKDLTGVDPANARIRALAQEAHKLDSGENKDVQLNIAAEKEGVIPPNAVLGPGGQYFYDRKTKEVIPTEQIRSYSAAQRVYKYGVEKEKNDMSLAQAQGEDVTKRRGDQFMQSAIRLQSEAYDYLEKTTVGSVLKLNELANSPAGAAALKKDWTPDEHAQIAASMVDFRRKLNINFEKEANEARAHRVPESTIEAGRASLKSFIADVEYGITNKDVGVLNKLSNKKTNIMDNKSVELLSTNPALTEAAAIKNLGGDTFLNLLFTANPEFKNSVYNELKNDGITAVVAGHATPEQVLRNMKRNKVLKEGEWKDFLEVTKRVIKDKNFGDEARRVTAGKLFGGENINMLELMKNDPAMQQRFYEVLVNPDMTKSVNDLAAETKNDQVKIQYQMWATYNFQDITARPITDLKQRYIDNPRSYAGLLWNPNNYQFEVYQRNPDISLTERKTMDPSSRLMDVERAKQEIMWINRQISNVVSIYQSNGVDPSVGLQQKWLAKHGIDLYALTPPSYRTTVKERPSGE